MITVETAQVGPLRLRLIEQPSALEPTFFAARYYFEARHDVAPAVAAICYLGHDKAHAMRQYGRRVDNENAKLEADRAG